MGHSVLQWMVRLIALVLGCGLFVIAILGLRDGDISVVLGFVLGPVFVVYAIGGNTVFQKFGRLSKFGERWP